MSQPWGDIRCMGNRLRHAYDRIDLDVLWNTIRERLRSLKPDPERALLGLKAEGDRGDGNRSRGLKGKRSSRPDSIFRVRALPRPQVREIELTASSEAVSRRCRMLRPNGTLPQGPEELFRIVLTSLCGLTYGYKDT